MEYRGVAMEKNKNKVLIPTYRMERNGFYLLLRVRMESRGGRNINGVGKEFFAPETYQGAERLLADLTQRKLVEQQEGNVLIREGLEKALDRILESPYCMNFQNSLLQKKGQILTFYYADDAYVGVLLDKKETMLVVAPEEDALYKAFEKQLEDKSASRDFRPERWNVLWKGEDVSEENRGILQPAREARITHSGNRVQRERFNTAMVADGRQIQVIRGADSLPWKSLNRETVPAKDWYGVICQELERLKAESRNQAKKGRKNPGKEDVPRLQSEYQRVTAMPDFPKSRLGFLFWSLKRILLGLPKMVLGMVRRKSLALLLYPLWGALLFFYNMYITCYFNDTFMLGRRARLGDWSPYLMAGTLQTPSALKGLQMQWGLIDTSFLVWPLMMVVTLLGRHLVLQLRRRRAGFFGDLLKIPAAVRDCGTKGHEKGKSMWIVLALAWILGFFIMNPITMFLSALLLLLMFAQGAGNSLVQIAFLWECAGGRKKIDAGRKPEPDSGKYRMLLFHGSMGFGLYGLVSLLLWFAVDYNWWIRLAVTVLMVLFALLQVFMPGAISGRLRSRAAVFFLLCLVVLCAAAIFGGSVGVVFADDGGWSESGGTLAGLMQNAGFGIILGISLLTIGLGLGLPLAGVAIASLIAGGGTFLVGLTDTKAGNYVKKSARQYFFGAEEGENKTVFCTATEILNFVSGFMNPTAEMTGSALKVFQGGKLVGDVASAIGDTAGALDDLKSFVSDSGDVGLGDLLWDTLGLGLDFWGMKGDYDDFKKVLDTPGMKGSDFGKSLREQYREMQDSGQSELANMESNINTRRQAELDAEKLRHQNKMNDIQDTINRLENGEINPPAGLDRDAYLRELNRSLGAETAINADKLSQIRDTYREELRNGIKQLNDSHSRKEREFFRGVVKDFVKDHGYDAKSEWDNLTDFLSTNGYLGKSGGGIPDKGAGMNGGSMPDSSAGADGDIVKDLLDLPDEELGNLTDEELERLIDEMMERLTDEESERLMEGLRQYFAN